MTRNDPSFGVLPYSKYGLSYSIEQTKELASMHKNINLQNLSQIISENLTNLYLEKIKLLGEAEEVWQKEYILCSGFAQEIWR